MPYAKYNPGDENKRIDQFLDFCPIKVFLIDLKNGDEIVKEYDLDYSNHADRKRLGRITFWAITHGHSIETMHRDEAEPPIQKG